MMRARLATLALCLLAGCSMTGNQTAALKGQNTPPPRSGTSDCFYARQAQSFVALDRSNLIVYAPNDANAFHVLVSPPTALRSAETLKFLPSDARICGYAGERLIVVSGPAREVLAVIDVSRVAPGSLAAMQASAAGENPPSARPQPGPGAEIEGIASQTAPEKLVSPGEN